MEALGAPWAARNTAGWTRSISLCGMTVSLVCRGDVGIGMCISTSAGRFRGNLLEKMEKNMSLSLGDSCYKTQTGEIRHTIPVEQGFKPWLKIGIPRSFKKYWVLA